jgi:hypothetical protein
VTLPTAGWGFLDAPARRCYGEGLALTLARRLILALAVLAVTGALAPVASASTFVDRGTHYQSLKVDSRGVALVTYYAHHRTWHVLVWGAINAVPPNAAHPKSQVKFHINYSGGYGSFLGRGYWREVANHNVCTAYSGPALYRMVKGCTAPNGSFWAIQRWQRGLPDNGWTPTSTRESEWELNISHWSGALPVLWFKADWIYAGARGGPFDQIYGTFTYQNNPVYGFGSTSRGAPTDSFGRLIYMDTLNPPWKRGYRQLGGWYRYNAFLTHRPHGDFCPGVYGAIASVKTRNRPGRGTEYRITASGPGVTPIVVWRDYGPGYYVPGLSNLSPTKNTRGPYSATLDHRLNTDLRTIDPRPEHRNSCYHTH